MKDNHAPLAFTPTKAPGSFEKGELLKARKLNDALQSVANTGFLAASAPPVPGVFRPWWWNREANHVGLGDDENMIVVKNLFVSMETGLPLFVEHADVRFVVDGAGVYLTPDGTLTQKAHGDDECGGRESMRIATHRRGEEPQIDVLVADLGATEELRAVRERVCVVVGEWFRRGLGTSQHFAFMENLAFLRHGDALPERQVRKLAEVGATIRQRLGESTSANVIPPGLEGLEKPPESPGHDALCKWLTVWAKTFRSEALLRRYFEPESLLEPKRRPGQYKEGNWYEFDISSSNAKKVELLASKLLHQASASFNTRNRNSKIENMEPISEGRYSVVLNRPPGSTTLYVLADDEHLQLRLLTPQEK